MSFGIPVRNGLSVSLVSSTFLSSGRRISPALNLNFLSGGPLDSRITFSRTSQATLTDSTGKLTYAPNNLLTYSEQFDNAAWTKFNASAAANTSVAPDGSMTADTITEGSTTTWHSVFTASPVTVVVGQNYTLSIYLKAGTRRYVQLALGALGAGQQGNFGVVVDTSVTPMQIVGTGNGTSGTYIASSIQNAGDGWYRISVTGNIGNTSGFFSVSGAAGDAYSTNPVNNGSGTFIIWGAQLEQVTYQTTPGTYNPTTVKNLLGYSQEFDNAAWTKSNAFVQTNLLVQSQAFDTAAWAASDTTATSNVSAAPDGTTTADRIAETATTAFHAIVQTLATVSATNHVLSIYLKKGSGATAPDWVQLTFGGASTSYANFNLSTGAVGVVSGLTASISNVGSGWYRCSVVVNIPSAGALSVQVCFTNNTDSATRRPSYAGAATSDVLLWGAQLVQGSTAGDYQRTDATAAAVQYVAPDGSLTADKLVENTATNQHAVFQTPTFTSGTPYTWSAHVKAAGRTIVQLRNYATAGVYFVEFDLVALTTTNRSGSGVATITSVGNDWYRISATATATASGSGYWQLNLCDAPAGASYTGDGTSGIYIWGAQLSDSASLDPYVYNPVAAPSNTAYYGPRYDYDAVTLAPKGLLIEEQRTNLLLRSEEFDNASWTKLVGATVSPNTTVAPNGTTTADTISLTATAISRVEQATTVTSGTTYTLSVWMRVASGTLSVRLQGIDTGTGSAFTVTTDWQRFSLVGVASSGTRYPAIATDGTAGDVFVWGAQLEAGSFATSYIPTVASQVTRTADVALMQGANFSNWYNLNTGTWVVGWSPYAVTGSVVAQISAATNNDRFQILNDNSSQVAITTGGVGQGGVDAGTVSAGTSNKLAFAYQTNDVPASLNGGAVVADTSVIIPVVDRLCIGATVAPAGFLNGHIRSIGYYPTRLSNLELQRLTQ